jgi:hypothetical protein
VEFDKVNSAHKGVLNVPSISIRREIPSIGNKSIAGMVVIATPLSAKFAFDDRLMVLPTRLLRSEILEAAERRTGHRNLDD